jgi:hypothetical protein
LSYHQKYLLFHNYQQQNELIIADMCRCPAAAASAAQQLGAGPAWLLLFLFLPQPYSLIAGTQGHLQLQRSFQKQQVAHHLCSNAISRRYRHITCQAGRCRVGTRAG